jgi:glycosyltransferase involved in cell wall biosynthesis
MPAVSVLICCANSASTLAHACRSVAWADELVIVDSGSSDATAAIAQQFADRYHLEPWRGYSAQKQFGLSLCKHDWVLLLDGDEACSCELAGEIQSLAEADLGQVDLLLARRRNFVMGRPVRAWWPDWQSRFMHRHRVGWGGEALHDGREADPARTGRFKGWIEHKQHGSLGFGDYFSGKRLDERLLLVAQEMHRAGQRCRWFDLALRPSLTFWKFYLLKRGFLDGIFGLLIAQKAAVSVQLKYAALWAVQHGVDKPGPDQIA